MRYAVLGAEWWRRHVFPSCVTLHYGYGTVLGGMLCSCPYTGTSLVPYRKLPTTVIMNTESSPVSPYSNLVSCNSTGLLEPKTYTFEYYNKLLLKLKQCREYRVRTTGYTVRYNQRGAKPHTRGSILYSTDLSQIGNMIITLYL